MKAWQQTRIHSTPMTATLALALALALGGAAGYTVRDLAQPQDASTSQSRHIVNPGIGQHRLDSLDADDPEPASQEADLTDATALESTHIVNPGIGLHRLDAYEIELR